MISFNPEILNIGFEKITEYQANLSWQTNVPCSSLIEYTNLNSGEVKEITDKQFLKEHKLELDDLEPDVNYSLVIKAKDELGQEAISPAFTFSTGEDLYAPNISQIRTNTALSSKGETVQAIISWLTDEPSNSMVSYQEGAAYDPALVKSTPLDNTLTRKHIVVISSFRPATVYLFRVHSGDSSGNTAISEDFTLLTPQQRRTIVQIMMENFEQTFGWVKNLGF